MKRAMLSLVLVPAMVLAAATAQAANAPLTLKSVDVSLPDDASSLPDRPGVQVVQNNCTGCHSPGMILTQPALSQAAWQAEVTKMRDSYKAPVEEKDVPAIVAYLTALRGPK